MKNSMIAKALKNKQLRYDFYIFSLALVIRLIHLYGVSRNPTFTLPIIDCAAYDFLAEGFANGDGITERFFWQVFFYPLYLGIIYVISGSSIIFAKISQLFLGAVTCVLTRRLGRGFFDEKTGFIAAVITAFYGPLIFFDAELLATGWAVFWSVFLVFMFCKALDTNHYWVFILLGISGALSILTRSTFVPFFIIACIWVLLVRLRAKSEHPQQLTLRFSLLAASFLLIMIPVGIMSYRTTGSIISLPKSGPINLYMGNNPDTEHSMALRPGSDWENLRTLPKLHGAKTDKQIEQFYIKEFFNIITKHPLKFIGGLLNKTIQFTTSREVPSNIDMYLWRTYSLPLKLLLWKVGGFGFPFGLLLPLFVIGLCFYWRKMPIPMYLFLILYPAAIILVFVTGRYRMPLIPIMSIIAALGILKITSFIMYKKWLYIGLMAGIIGLIATLSSIAGPFGGESINYEAEMYYCVGSQQLRFNQVKEAVDSFEKAIELKADYGDAYVRLGSIYFQSQDLERAEYYFKKSIQYNPDDYMAYNNIGSCLGQQGKNAESVKFFLQAISLNPEYESAYFNLGAAMLTLGYKDKALNAFKKTHELALKNKNDRLLKIATRQIKALQKE